MAELADALDLGSSGRNPTKGSTPFWPTNLMLWRHGGTADPNDSKSFSLRSVGSSPTVATNIPLLSNWTARQITNLVPNGHAGSNPVNGAIKRLAFASLFLCPISPARLNDAKLFASFFDCLVCHSEMFCYK